MGKANKEKSVYRETREELGLSRETASELMEKHGHVLSEKVLADVEEGDTRLRPEHVVAMADGYNAPHLMNHYCTHECEIGKRCVPEVTATDNVYKIVINLLASLDSMEKQKKQLVAILADGKVRDDEIKAFIAIEDKLEEIAVTVEALQLWCRKQRGENKDFRRCYDQLRGQTE